MSDFKIVTHCRICGSGNLRQYLDLGNSPLANALLSSSSASFKRYPLVVLFCEECSLSQLSIVINPNILYRDYPYHSSVSKTFQDHCLEMAKTLKKMTLIEDPHMVDIASNDGCLLEQFKKSGFSVIGVEPSKNLAREANQKGLFTINDFWSEESSNAVIDADVITALNVFAHVDDLKSFLKGVTKSLHKSGVLVIEVPYLYNLLSKNQFDTIYHEHLSYFLLKPLVTLFNSSGLTLFRVEEYDIHGGSIRVYASKDRPVEKSVDKMLAFEKKKNLHDFKTYIGYAEKAESIRDHFLSLLLDLKRQNKKVMGYGASAKGISLMNYCNIDHTYISEIVDDTPDKQGKVVPGARIPIVSRDRFDTNMPDYIALLSWNFSDELMNNTISHKARGGRYIIPIPKVSIL